MYPRLPTLQFGDPAAGNAHFHGTYANGHMLREFRPIRLIRPSRGPKNQTHQATYCNYQKGSVIRTSFFQVQNISEQVHEVWSTNECHGPPHNNLYRIYVNSTTIAQHDLTAVVNFEKQQSLSGDRPCTSFPLSDAWTLYDGGDDLRPPLASEWPVCLCTPFRSTSVVLIQSCLRPDETVPINRGLRLFLPCRLVRPPRPESALSADPSVIVTMQGLSPPPENIVPSESSDQALVIQLLFEISQPFAITFLLKFSHKLQVSTSKNL